MMERFKMPIYEYRCKECGVKFEKVLPMSSSPVPPCPSCGSSGPEKLISVPGGLGGDTAGFRGQGCPAGGAGACPKSSGFS